MLINLSLSAIPLQSGLVLSSATTVENAEPSERLVKTEEITELNAEHNTELGPLRMQACRTPEHLAFHSFVSLLFFVALFFYTVHVKVQKIKALLIRQSLDG